MVVLRAGNFGDRVRSQRERKGWSQERLAQEAGVSQTTIDKIERGATKRSRFAPDIARALDVSLNDLTHPDYELEIEKRGLKDFLDYRRDGSRYTELLIAAEDRSGVMLFGSEKIDDVEIPDSIVRKDETFAVQLASTSMGPEFEAGDVIFLEGGLKPTPGYTHVFTDENLPTKRGMIGRLSYFDDDTWMIQRWRGGSVSATAAEAVSRKEFPRHFRVSARHLRR